jgi:hypothetical protein
MECPKCSYVRQEKDSVVPDWQCPKCGVVYSKFKAAISKSVKVRLISGQEITFNKIKLYDLTLIKKLDELRQSIDKNFRGYSSGIGFIGSTEDVIAGSLVTGAIDSIVSGSMAKQGANQLNEAVKLSKQIRDTGVYVQVSAIENIQYPEMELWKALHYDKSVKRELVHMYSKYIFVMTDDKETALFWDKVEQYSFLETV